MLNELPTGALRVYISLRRLGYLSGQPRDDTNLVWPRRRSKCVLRSASTGGGNEFKSSWIIWVNYIVVVIVFLKLCYAFYTKVFTFFILPNKNFFVVWMLEITLDFLDGAALTVTCFIEGCSAVTGCYVIRIRAVLNGILFNFTKRISARINS